MMGSDEALYQDVRGGSQAAFAMLYAKYERPLFGFLLKRLGNRQEAEEVFQEAMIAIYRGPEALHERGAFAAWLYKVAIHLSLNRARSRKREQQALAKVVPFETERLQTPGSEVDAIEAETERERIEREGAVRHRVQELKPQLREVYELRQEGRSYEEMAEIVGVPVGTIKSRIHKMMNQLRKEVGKWIAK